MPGLLKRESAIEPVFDRFDRMFDEWMRVVPFRRLRPETAWTAEEVIRLDEYRENGSIVVKAELPGIDPDRDVEVTVSDGMLCIHAERRAEEKTEEKGYVRQELHYGSFSRTLPLPEGVSEADVKATYKDGILEIRVPAPTPPAPAAKIPVQKG